MIVIATVVLLIVYLGVNIIALLIRNHEAHKFFKTKSPKLPVVPNPNIFSGNMMQVLAPWKNWKIIDELHQKLGPSFGYYYAEIPYVSTMDLDLIKLIQVDRAQKHLDRAFFGSPFGEINHSIAQVNGDKWRQVRRIFTPAFTNYRVKSEEVSSDIESVVEKLAAAMDRRTRKALDATGGKSASFIVDATNMFDRYTLETIFLLTYKKADLIDFDAEQDKWVHTIDAGSRDVPNPVLHASIMFPFLRPLCCFLGRALHESGQTLLRVGDFIEQATDLNRVAREQHSKLQKRLSLTDEGHKVRDFADVKSAGNFKRRMVDTIIDAFLDKRIDHDNFRGSLAFLLLAGFKTTSDTISALVWRLAKNPDIQEQLRKTLWEEGIDADHVVWCIKEVIRLHPAVPLGAGRVLGEDVEVNGQLYAKGTFVMTSTWSIHHDPKIWPEPERFLPERWRDTSNFHPAQFVGFGLGPRNCLGGKLAIHEIKLVIQMILNNYRIEVCDETPDEWRWSSPGMFYTIPDDPITVKFTPLDKTKIYSAAA